MNTKLKAGFAGAIAVVAILLLQAIEHWSIIDAVMTKLRSLGPSGAFVADIILSPVVPLVIAVAAIYLVFEGRVEKGKYQKELGDNAPKEVAAGVKESGNSTAVGGGATASSAGNTLNQTFVLGEVARSKPETLPLTANQPAKRKKSVALEMDEVKAVVLNNDAYGTWYESQSGHHWGLVVPIYYDPKKSERHTELAVKAHLLFVDTDGKRNIVPAGCWLESHLNTIIMNPGDQRLLLLVLMGRGVFAALHNRLETEDPYSDSVDAVKPITLSSSAKKVEIVCFGGMRQQC